EADLVRDHVLNFLIADIKLASPTSTTCVAFVLLDVGDHSPAAITGSGECAGDRMVLDCTNYADDSTCLRTMLDLVVQSIAAGDCGSSEVGRTYGVECAA
ncbi:hypothetical protein SARC_14835, partial [Sphaeroforma arctica JP610]